jgi:hypothetical protein
VTDRRCGSSSTGPVLPCAKRACRSADHELEPCVRWDLRLQKVAGFPYLARSQSKQLPYSPSESWVFPFGVRRLKNLSIPGRAGSCNNHVIRNTITCIVGSNRFTCFFTHRSASRVSKDSRQKKRDVFENIEVVPLRGRRLLILAYFRTLCFQA